MSTSTNTRHPKPETPIDHAEVHTAHFATRLLPPNTVVVTAQGEIDAANSQELVDYAMRHGARIQNLVLDMSEVEFFGTSGFSALHTLNIRCAGESIKWASVPSAAVTKLLAICDPDSALPFYERLDSALSAVADEPRPSLQLITKTR
ncbi:STAS domain-containing protein [Mycolicibacterium moriokaense]|jgi:anti-anti-sigma factor|nr:STAS domain-containing protein [Mycolicibacterium moriokaense]MCV7037253.1 STAS domain-containing protein [Mycolicibacterium moriokaense]